MGSEVQAKEKTPGKSESSTQSASLDDEMSKLLGELSGSKR